MSRPWIVLIALAALILVACGSGDSEPTGTPVTDATATVQPVEPTATASIGSPELDDTSWRLSGMGDTPGTLLGDITLEFATGSASGFAGCNSYSATAFTTPDNGLVVREVIQTDMHCGLPQGVMDIEQEFLDRFGQTASYEVSEHQLVLFDDQGDPLLTFLADHRHGLGQTVWLVLTVNGEPLEVAPHFDWAGVAFTFMEQRVLIGTECVMTFLNYRSEAIGTIELSNIDVADWRCQPDNPKIEPAEAFVATLVDVTSVRMLDGGRQLELASADGDLVILLENATPDQGTGLLGYTRWVLEELNGNPAPDDALTLLMFTHSWSVGRVGCLEGFPSAEFAADGSLTPYERDYYQDGLCGPEGPGASARAIVEVAATATHYRQTPGRLDLRNSDDQPVLVFRQLSRETELDDTVWAAVTIHGQPILDGTDLTLRFSNGGYSGSDGCNGIGGDFMVPAPGQIFWSAGPTTDMDCPETVPGEDAQRERFASIIKAPAYQLTDTTLELFDDQGDLIAEFVRVPQRSGLEDVRWLLTTMNGAPVSADTNISLAFQGNAAGGWSSCNNYNLSGVEIGRESFSFDDLGREEEGCEPGMPEPEYFDALMAAKSYQLANETLTLIDAAGEAVLTFRQASGEADLGGQTWQLIYLNGVRLVDGNRPMFTFRNGEIVAHTLCTEFTFGGLAFNGTRITITGPISVWEHSCEEPDEGHTYNTQLDLSDAIASIAGYSLSNRTLALLDNTGKAIMLLVPASR